MNRLGSTYTSRKTNDGDDDDDDDLRSISQISNGSTTLTGTPPPSPTTQTLNELLSCSQTTELHMSQLEYDVATMLAGVRERSDYSRAEVNSQHSNRSQRSVIDPRLKEPPNAATMHDIQENRDKQSEKDISVSKQITESRDSGNDSRNCETEAEYPDLQDSVVMELEESGNTSLKSPPINLQEKDELIYHVTEDHSLTQDIASIKSTSSSTVSLYYETATKARSKKGFSSKDDCNSSPIDCTFTKQVHHQHGGDKWQKVENDKHGKEHLNRHASPSIRVDETKKRKREPSQREKKGHPIHQIDCKTGEILATFPSVLEAARTMCIDHQILRRATESGAVKGGYNWTLVDSQCTPKRRRTAKRPRLLKTSERLLVSASSHKTQPQVQKVSVRTGRVIAKYKSLAAASKAAQLSPSELRKHLDSSVPLRMFLWRTFKQDESESNNDATSDGDREVPNRRSTHASRDRRTSRKRPCSAGVITSRNKNRNLDKSQPVSHSNTKSLQVQKVDTATHKILKTFASIREAAMSIGVSYETLRKTIRKKEVNVGDFFLKICERKATPRRGESKPMEKGKSKSVRKHQAKALQVQALDPLSLNVVATYSSGREASQATGISRHKLATSNTDGAQREGDFLWRAAGKALVAKKPKERGEEKLTDDEGDGCPKIASERTNQSIIVAREQSDLSTSAETGFEAKLLELGYTIFDVVVKGEGALGMVISRQEPPQKLQQLVFSENVKAFAEGADNSCKITSINEHSLAQRAGLKAGDWLLAVSDPAKIAETDAAVFGHFDQIRFRAKQWQRPITLTVCRRAASPLDSVASTISVENEVSQPIDVLQKTQAPDAKCKTVSSVAERKDIRQSPHSVLERKPSWAEYYESDKVPFCAFCREIPGARTSHHAWCPRNPQFEDGGADEVLDRIRQGVELDCPRCIMEFRTGRMSHDQSHSMRCRSNQRRLRHRNGEHPGNGQVSDIDRAFRPVESHSLQIDLSEERRGSNGLFTKAEATFYPESGQWKVRDDYASSQSDDVIKRNRKHKSCRKRIESDLNCCSNPISDVKQDKRDADAISAKGIATQPKHCKENNKWSTSYSQPENCHKMHNSLATRIVSPITHFNLPTKVKSNSALCGTRHAASQSNARGAVRCKQSSQVSDSNEEKVELVEVEAEDDSDTPLDVAWMPCGNPWGQLPWNEFDAIIYKPTVGLAHPDSLLPSARFALDPLNHDSSYCITHHSPEEGFHGLVLTRDPMQSQPWGFSVKRHEFGGACLIRHVDPFSPAENAYFVGGSLDERSMTSLCVNDMLIAINGKDVGGMTEIALDLEVETSGTRLMLLVSRLKHTARDHKQHNHAERNASSLLDQAINDKTRLEWIEVGDEESASDEENHLHAPGFGERIEIVTADATSSSDKNGQHGQSSRLACFEGKIETIANHESVETCDLSGNADVRRNSDQTITTVESKNDWENDDNAWFGCVCGKTHNRRIPVFWIQCDICSSWYNVSSKCVGFFESDVSSKVEWACEGCEQLNLLDELKSKLNSNVGNAITNVRSGDERKRSNEIAPAVTCEQDSTRKGRQSDDFEAMNDTVEVFSKGAIVMIKEHGWPGVNNEEGVAQVLDTYIDDEGDRLYDVKYIVGRMKRGILAKYVRSHTF